MKSMRFHDNRNKSHAPFYSLDAQDTINRNFNNFIRFDRFGRFMPKMRSTPFQIIKNHRKFTQMHQNQWKSMQFHDNRSKSHAPFYSLDAQDTINRNFNIFIRFDRFICFIRFGRFMAKILSTPFQIIKLHQNSPKCIKINENQCNSIIIALASYRLRF